MPIPAAESSFKDIPEFYEKNIGESIFARTDSLHTWQELGAPDLCHIVKVNTKTLKEVGSYHFVLGPDASSTASLAAYLNTLVYRVGTSKHTNWRVKMAAYCAYNAFSKVDVRVTMQIPGGVDAHVVNQQGEKSPVISESVWRETFVSAVLRSIHDDNDRPNGNNGRPLLGLKKVDPLPSLVVEKRFLQAVEQEFWNGWKLGTDHDVQVATLSNNYLTNGVYKYFKDGGRLDEAAKFFEPLYQQDNDVGPIYTRCLLGSDNETLGVRVMYDVLKKTPYCYGILLNQIELLTEKGRLTQAAKLAQVAVVHASSEFHTWAKLAEIYTKMGDYEAALLALNACPMYTFIERDGHSMPPPLRVHRPLRPDPSSNYYTGEFKHIQLFTGSLMEENEPRENEVHPELQRQPALALRGTFLLAYKILIQIYNATGWDSLLKFRSSVFVMKEEYAAYRNMEKSKISRPQSSNGESTSPNSPVDSTTMSPQISHASNPVSPMDGLEGKVNDLEITERGGDKASEGPRLYTADSSEILKLSSVTTKDEVTSASKEAPQGLDANGDDVSESNAFKNKRLCEKWLDNLFMILYADVRLFTLLKQEIGKPVSSAGYRKSGAEWEMIGDLAHRLGHDDEAVICFHTAIAQRISIKAHLVLIQIYSDFDINNALLTISRALPLLDRIFTETVFPSPIGEAIIKLVGVHGLAKVQNTLVSLHIPARDYKLMTKYLEYVETFSCRGYDW